MKVIPLFKSNFSIGRSILTLESLDDLKKKREKDTTECADSIIEIAKLNEFKELYLVEDKMGGVLQAYKNLKDLGCKLIFGIRVTICPNALDKNDTTKEKESKYIIFARNNEGYKKLIKIYSFASKEGLHKYPRTDFNHLKEVWSDNDLVLAVPFYDSFIYNNAMTFSSCIPDFSFTCPTFFWEDNGLPFDQLIQEKIKNYVKDQFPIQYAKTIYYINRKDFKAFQTYKCLSKTESHERSTLEKPEFPHFSSSEFCLEAWKEQNG